MATLEVTFTLALPVCAAQLGAHLEAYLDTLPALNALRACNRFGKGPACHIREIPAELVQTIAQYYILPVREEKLSRWMICLDCFTDSCEPARHYCSRERLLAYYHKIRENDFFELPGGDDSDDDDPNDYVLEQLRVRLDETMPNGHYKRRGEWQTKVHKVLISNRALFRKHFGLDIWLSNVCMGTSSRDRPADTTVTNLVLPDRVTHSQAWTRHMSEDGYDEPTYESGYGMTVSMDKHPTPEDIQNFKRAMKVLDLKPFVHETQSQKKALSLASTKEKGQTPALVDTASSFPRPMLLIRNTMEGEQVITYSSYTKTSLTTRSVISSERAMRSVLHCTQQSRAQVLCHGVLKRTRSC